jgi:hypothetical protein
MPLSLPKRSDPLLIWIDHDLIQALTAMPLLYAFAGWGRLMRTARVPVWVGWGQVWCSARLSR